MITIVNGSKLLMVCLSSALVPAPIVASNSAVPDGQG